MTIKIYAAILFLALVPLLAALAINSAPLYLQDAIAETAVILEFVIAAILLFGYLENGESL